MTANIDPHTDRLLQATIRRLFASQTVITIAHRLQTVVGDCDRVLVLEDGRIVEFDSPHELLKKKEGGAFYEMVRKTGPAVCDQLHQLAWETYQRKRETREEVVEN